MSGLEDRRHMTYMIKAAHGNGASLYKACQTAGITVLTLQRWHRAAGTIKADARPEAERPIPGHALSEDERAEVLIIANEPRFADQPPASIVPALANGGCYVASESTFYRILRAQDQNAHRGRTKAPQASRNPTTHVDNSPRQVWCWDMTYLPTQVAGRWFYLYLIMDLYSRKIVGWEVHEQDDSTNAAHLVRRTALVEGIAALDHKPVLHGDNGSTLKAKTVLAMLHWHGVKPSYSRPRVSDENAFVESLFRTTKYRTEFPARRLADLQAARDWPVQFVHWYNPTHTCTAVSATSVRRHDTKGITSRSLRQDTRSTNAPVSNTHRAGVGIRATGSLSAASRSTLSTMQ